MTLSELKALWAKWVELHGAPVKPFKGQSVERYAALAMRDIVYHFEHCNDELTLEKVVNAPGLGVKRIKYLEEVLNIKFPKKVKPVKPEKMVYVLLEKFLDTEEIRVVGLYDSFELVMEVMEDHMDLFEEKRSYKVEAKAIITEKGA